MSQAFGLHGDVSIDARKALNDLRDLREAAREAFAELQKIAAARLKAGSGRGGMGGKSAAREAREEARAAVTASRAQAASTRAATAEINKQIAAQRLAAQEAKKADAAQRTPARQARDDAKKMRDELRKQKEAGAAWAREIEAGWRRNGETMNRFGDKVKTVSGYLKDISRDVHIGLKVENGDSLNDVRRKVLDVRRQAGAIDVDLKTDDAKREVDELARKLHKLGTDARASLTVGDGGVIRSASFSSNGGAAKEKRQAARAQIAEGASNAATVAGAGILATLGLATKAAVEFDDAFIGVEKTVDASAQQLAKLKTQIRQMATEIPMTATALAGIAENAGQLGIKTQAIGQFTRTIAALSVATNLGADEGSAALAKIANITKMSQADFERLGSTIVALGNDGASTEKDIAEMALRIAGAGSQVGMSEAQILSYANALSSVGIEAEAGGSAISKVFVATDQAVRKGGEELKRYAKIAGVTSGEFKRAFEQDAASALASFIEGLGKLKKSGGDVFGVLDKMGMSEVRTRDALLRLSGNSNLLAKSLHVGSQAWKENTALADEAKKKYGSTSSQLKIFQNRLNELAITAGGTLIPALNSLLKAGEPLFKWFTSQPLSTQANIVKYTTLAGVLLLVGGRVNSLIQTFALLRSAGLLTGSTTKAVFKAMRLSATRDFSLMRSIAVKSVTSIGSAFSKLGAVGGPIALVAIAVAGFTTAFFGARDAGVMSAEKLIEKWGALGEVWVKGGDALGNLISKLNGTEAADAEATAGMAAVKARQAAARKSGKALPKSEHWKKAHGVDGSHAGGLERVPRDGYVAELHKDEAVLTKSQAEDWRASKVRALEDRLGAHRLNRAQSGARGRDVEGVRLREQLRQARRELADYRAEHSATSQKVRAELKLEKDQLRDTAQEWDNYAQRVEDAAKKQLDALGEMRDAFRGLFEGAQSRLLDLGVTGNPLGRLVTDFEKRLGLADKAKKVQGDANKELKRAYDKAGAAKSALDKANGGDGYVPGTTGASTQASPSTQGGKARGGAAREISTAMMLQIAKSFTKGEPYLSCAFVASRLANAVGANIKTTASAGGLRQNAIRAGWQRVDPHGIQAGDLIFNRRNGGSGWHVKTGAQNGYVVNSNHRLETMYRYRPKPGDEVYRAPSRDGVTIPASAGSTMSGGSTASSPRAALRVLRETFSGSLSDIAAVDKNWGAAVKNIEGYSTRFAVQTALASKKFQATIRAAAKESGQSVGQIVRDLRTFANAADFGASRETAIDAIDAKLKELDKTARGRGRGNSAIAQLNEQLSEWKRLKVPTGKIKALYTSVTMDARESGASGLRDNLKALQERARVLAREAQLVAAGVTDGETRNEILEIEAQKLLRLKELREASWTPAMAAAMANQEATQTRINNATARANALLVENAERLKEAREASAQLRGDEYLGVFEKLSEVLSDANASADDLRQALAGLPAGAHRMPGIGGLMNDIERRIPGLASREKSRPLLDDARAAFDDAQRSLREYSERELSPAEIAKRQRNVALDKLIDVGMSGTGRDSDQWRADLEEAKRLWDAVVASAQKMEGTRVTDYTRGVRERVALAAELDPQKRELLNIRQQLTREGWTQADIEKILPVAQLGMQREEFLGQLQQARDGMQNVFADAFKGITDGGVRSFGQFFDKIGDGLGNLLTQMASQILASWAVRQLSGLFGGIAGITGMGGTPGIAVNGSHAGGLERVPFNGYIAQLHRDEMVLTAREAARYREMGNRLTLSQSRVANGRASTQASSSTTHSTVNYNGPITIKANNTRELERELPSQKLASREAARRQRLALSG